MKKAIVPLCLLIIIAVGFFLYITRFINYSVVEIDGYAFRTNDLVENLNNSKEKKIPLQKVLVNETIYKSNNKFYVGDEKKSKINLEYPIVSKDSSSIYIASNVGEYVTDNFDFEVSYPGTIITDSKVYNTNDYEQATDYNYFFVALANGLYVNLDEITIKSYSYEINIPVNSFIKFNNNSLKYYYLYKGKYLYKEYPVIDNKDEFTIGEYQDTYYNVMTKLSVIPVKHDSTLVDDDDEESLDGKDEVGDSQEVAESSPEYIKKEKKEHEEKGWIAPEVYVNDTYAKTYSYRGKITVSDPSFTISKSPVFEFKINNSVALRKTVSNNGSFKITGLLPNTEYEVSAYYEYYDEVGVKRQKKIKFNDKDYVDIFTTEGTDMLNKLDFELGDITTDIDSFVIENVKLNNDIEDEALNGVKGVTVQTVDGNFVFTSADIKNLVNKIDFSFKSAKTLKSNHEYEATIKVVDTIGNTMLAKNNTFTFKTKQKAPSAKINVSVSKNFTRADMNINIKNTDNVIVSNYRYVVYDENTNQFQAGNVDENDGNYVINGLDTAKKYFVKVFCSYKTNEDYVFDDVEIGSTEFISFDIEKLGNIPFTVTSNNQRDDYLTPTSASIAVSYANYSESDEIYNLIDNDVILKIVNHETREVEYTDRASKFDFVIDHIFDICYGGDILLKSNTVYDVELEVFVTSGDKVIPIKTTINSKGYSFKTLKASAYVSLTNIFIASGYIDFDAYIIDKDGSLLDSNEEQAETINLEIFNASKEKIYTEVLNVSNINDETGVELNRVTINSLAENQSYDFQFKASNFNDNLNSESDKVLDGSYSFYLGGLKSKIDVEEMIKTANYYNEPEDNLFELNDIIRWQSKHFSTYSPTEKISISSENNSISLTAYNGYRVYNYYLPELIGKSVVMSFKAKRGTDRDGRICIMNNMTNSVNNCFMDLDIDDSGYTEYNDITFTLNSTGYISFYITEVDNVFYNNTLILKDLKIEVGDTSTSYKAYDNSKGYIGTFNVAANVRINPEQENPGISVNQGIYEYNVSLLKDNERDRTELFEPEDGSFGYNDETKKVVFDKLEKDEDYKVAFSVYDKDLERFYDLSNVTFETEAEIRVVRNITDFFNMHKNGHYIAINDLDFSTNNQVYSGMFSGTLDMQGHKILLDSAHRSYLFHTLGGGGVIENADVHFNLNNTSAKSYYYGLVYDNYGDIQNFSITIDESIKKDNFYFSLLGWRNYGTIKNFYIHSKAPVYGYKWVSLGTRVNYGTIKNAYAYADADINAIDVSTNIPSADSASKMTGIFAMEATSGSIIENIYTTDKIYIGENPGTKDQNVGTIVGSLSSATLRNIYVYDDSNSVSEKRDKALDIMVGTVSNINYSNIYYISENEYAELYSKSRQLTALKNVSFQDQVLNDDNMFLTDKAWRLNIYPLLDLPECMPDQEPVTIPTLTGNDIKFLSVDDIKYLDNNYIATLSLSFLNPNGLNIRGVNIDDISTVDMDNKPSTNSDMITTVRVKLKNPAEYVSYYNLKSIVTSTGTIDLNTPMAFDLYKEVSNLTSITDMKTNYRLTADIDCEQSTCKNLSTYLGKLNGSGHTISNMKMSACFITTLRGTLKDINFVNFQSTNDTARTGIVCTLDSNGDIDSVSSYNSRLNAYSNNGVVYVGGIVGVISSGTVTNSAVNKMTVNADKIRNAIPVIGGIVGSGSNAIIDTSIARNIYIESNSMPGDSSGIGGIIGVFGSGKITNVYTTGIINNNTQYLGGLAGRISGTTASIIDAISKVAVSGEQDYIGGVDGYSASTNNVSKTIVLGDLSTKKQNAEFFDRTSGTAINRSRNFAWDKQAMNNIISQDTNGETLLSQEELWNPVIYSSKIGFGSHWVLDGEKFREGYIPLLQTSTGKVIRGQGYYEDEDQNIDDLRIFYESLFTLDSYSIDNREKEYAAGHSGDAYYLEKNGLEINIYNPRMYEIKSVVIDGITIDSTIQFPTNNTTTSITTMKYKVKPEKYFDNYYITKVIYYDENREEQEEEVSFSIEMPFYYNIKSANDWLRIEKLIYENYIMDRDIDLSSLNANQLIDKSFNRLVGLGNTKPVLSGINVTLNKTGASVIYTIVTELTNVKLENNYFKNNAGGNYTGFIKYLNGSMENVDFVNVTSDCAKASYTGVISMNQSPMIRNVYIDGADIKGVSYVGFIGKSNPLPKTSITLKNVTINATGTYVGGLYGYENWKEKGVYSSYIVGDNININQSVTKYGNAIGGLFGYGSGTNISIANSKIKGGTYVGGVAGQNCNRTNNYIYAYNNKVEGSSQVGGLMGYNQPIYASLVYNSEIIGTSKVGGVVGYSAWPTVYGTGSVGNTVTGKEYVGGVLGQLQSGSAQYDYVRDTNVQGESYVGGIVGATTVTDNTIQYNTTNAKVTATKDSAGGIIGYFNNTNTTTSRYRTRLYYNVVAGSKISAPDYAGGIVGRIEKAMYSNQFTNQYVDADVVCTNIDSFRCGYAIGTNDEFANIIARLYVYEGTTLTRYGTKTSFINSTEYSNGTLFGSGKVSGIARANEINTDAFYKTNGSKLRLSGFTWNATILQSTYPRPNYSSIPNKTIPTLLNEMPTLVEVTYVNSGDNSKTLREFGLLPLPQSRPSSVIDGATSLLNFSFNELPDAVVYPSSADTINVEFSYTDSDVVFKLNDKEEIPVEDRTYTFKFDFNSDLVVKVSNGSSQKEFNYSKEELRNKIGVVNNNYYFLKKNSVISNDRNISITNANNIFEDKILLATGNIYDIEAHTEDENTFENLEKVDTMPLYRFNYLDEDIETYYNYSMVNGEYYKGQLFVKNDKLEIIDNSIKNKKDKIIIDQYNNKDYLLYLRNDGVLYSLKENINYPKEFMNINIADISSTINTNTDIIFILYKDGNFMVFNYKTGTMIAKSYENTPTIYEYIDANYKLLLNPSNLGEPVSESYKESQKLVKKLEKTPIDDVLKDGEISKDRVNNSDDGEISRYTIKYNDKDNTYEVYELADSEYAEDIINSNSTIIKQINSPDAQEVIKESKILSRYYDIDMNNEQLKATNGFVRAIVIIISLIIGTSLIILGNLVIKKIAYRRT